ncbi:AbrB/MazE/SpoVT family DNA-binding domain-containing protein [Candidatus Collierbacteria bacterium]|nr:AbrB/MazE/SpoVT family DNA-binding domain-containing protein [Candidatus Collierbacteria bacterium]
MITPVAHKIIQVGNSLAVTLPKDFVKRHRLKAGGVAFSQSVNGEIKYATSKGNTTDYQRISDEEFSRLIIRIESIYGETLEKLAKLP